MRTRKTRRRFTEQGLERLKYDPSQAPPSGRIEIEDEVCPGLVLRVTPAGIKTFSVIYRVPGEGGIGPTGRRLAGKQHRITLGQTPPLGLKDAREKARTYLQAATEGRDPRKDVADHHRARHTNTFAAAQRRFIEQEIKPSVSAWKNVERVLKLHVEPRWRDTPIRDIRRSDVHELLDGLVQAGKIGTAREVRKHLSRFFNWAIDREIVADSPVHGLKRGDLQPPDEVGRALDDQELRAIWRGAKKIGYPFGSMYQLLILTGQRRGEWANALRSEIVTESRCLEIPRSRYKGRRDHIVPLSEAAWQLFEALPRWPGNDYFIFSSRNGKRPVSGFTQGKLALDNAALEVLRELEPGRVLADYRVHDFRVTCETRLAHLGFNQETRDAVLGHAKPGLQRTYNKHDYLEEKRTALAAYAEHLWSVVNGRA